MAASHQSASQLAWPEEVQAVAGAISDFGKPPRRAELAAAVLNHFEDVYALPIRARNPSCSSSTANGFAASAVR
ncbi:MAG: hypothetical protein ACLT4C_10270 [Butyricicoccus sp.]